jgi:hypothetical protein
MTIVNFLQKLQTAGLPVISASDDGAYSMSRELSATELRALLDIIEPAGIPGRNRQANAQGIAAAIPNWATWTQTQFQTWCDANLMSDAAIDATTLSAALKANIKANNAFTRNSGKLLIAIRDQTWPNLP